MTDIAATPDVTATPEADEATKAALWAEMTATVKGEKPEAKPVVEGKPVAEASAAPEQPPTEPIDKTEAEEEDIWAGASEAQKKAFDDLNHRLRSDQGRVGALQRQINELQRQMQASPAKPTEPSKAAVDWAVFEKEYPDEAKAFKALQAESEQKLQALQQKLDSLSANDSQFYDLLDAVRPDWRETVNAPTFSQWLSAQDEPTQAKLQSSKVGDAVSLLRAFDGHRDAAKAKADKIKQDRETRARNAETVPGRSAQPSLETAADDPETLWREATERVKKRRGL